MNIIIIVGGKGGKKIRNSQLMICLAYNSTHNYFSVAFFALLESKSKETYEELHFHLKKLRKQFKPALLTVDFEQAHIEVTIL